MTYHKQVDSGNGFTVDAEMLPFLKYLWEHGVETRFSCQGGGEEIDPLTGEKFSMCSYVSVAHSSIEELSPYFLFNDEVHIVRDTLTLTEDGNSLEGTVPLTTDDVNRVLMCVCHKQPGVVTAYFRHELLEKINQQLTEN